jgi:hypothetical protein
LISQGTGNAATDTGKCASAPLSRIEVDRKTERILKSSEASFLLDWLAGGEACRRNIEGFCFKFESLNVVIAD